VKSEGFREAARAGQAQTGGSEQERPRTRMTPNDPERVRASHRS